jgi:hypothetical protein
MIFVGLGRGCGKNIPVGEDTGFTSLTDSDIQMKLITCPRNNTPGPKAGCTGEDG